jgi:integrase
LGNSNRKDSQGGTLGPDSNANSPKGAVVESKSFRDGLIYLYKRADYKKPTWLCRVKVPNGKGYINRSTGTGDEHQAFKFADDLYNELLVKSLTGEVVSGKRIGPAIDGYVRRLEADKERLSVSYKILLMKRARPFLERKTFNEVSASLLSELVDYLSDKSTKKSLSPNSIKRIQSDLKHFFGWCVEQGHLEQLPRFPKVNSKASRRPHFDAKDWQHLTRHLREFVKVENRATRRNREMLRDYVLILANTGIRVGEARKLKWRDVREVPSSINGKSNVVLTVQGKTGRREVVASSADVKKYFQRLLELRKDELGHDPDIESFVFCHPDGSEIGSFKKSFASLMKSAGVEKDSFGEARTVYSLRHTYATFRLLEGVNHYALAKNMGTSVAMLEQFYGHTTNVMAADELTKRKRKHGGQTGSGSKGGSPLSWLQT